MIISNNVLSHHLENVLWICGGPCGGKSTITNLLADKNKFLTYHADDYFLEHQKLGSVYEQPAMTRHFVDWEWFFNRPEEEYVQWLKDSTEEQLSMIIVDLVKMSINKKKIVVDSNLNPLIIKQIASDNHIVSFFAESTIVKKNYFDREHTKGMLELIKSTLNPQKSLSNVQNVVTRLSEETLKQVKENGVHYFIRDTSTTLEEMLSYAEERFGLR